MKNNWYLIGVKHPEDNCFNHYVESMEFRNHYWKEFHNNTIMFTDNSNYALRLKSKMLALELKKVVEKAIPNLKVEVLEIDESWFRL